MSKKHHLHLKHLHSKLDQPPRSDYNQFMQNPERVHKFLTADLTVRASAIVATQVVEEMRAIQNTYPLATVAVGRAMVGSLLMASQMKQGQEISLYFRGNGPLESIFAEATFEGATRAFTPNPKLEIPPDVDRIEVGPAIGIGLLTVTHNLPNQDEPHRGTVIIRTGEIGDDIAFYLQQSHQIPSVVSIGVRVNTYGRVEAAGGVLIELMPGAAEDTIARIEKRVSEVQSVSQRIAAGATAEDLVRDVLGDFELLPMEHDYPVKYQCRCNEDRVKRSVTLLGLEEMDRVLEEGKPLNVNCEFCGRQYIISMEDLEKIRLGLYKGSLN